MEWCRIALSTYDEVYLKATEYSRVLMARRDGVTTLEVTDIAGGKLFLNPQAVDLGVREDSDHMEALLQWHREQEPEDEWPEAWGPKP